MLPEIKIQPCQSQTKFTDGRDDGNKFDKFKLDINKIVKLQTIPSKVIDLIHNNNRLHLVNKVVINDNN